MYLFTVRSFFALLLLASISWHAGAGLIDRGNGLIYDDVLDITWLQDANYGAGSFYDQTSNGNPVGVDLSSDPCCSPASDGLMTWHNAMAWAEDLIYEGYDDWRLPEFEIDTIAVYPNGSLIGAADCMADSLERCTTNEYGYMHRYNLGATPPPFGPGSDTTGDPVSVDGIQFFNVQNYYWSGTESFTSAWAFVFAGGGQGSDVDADWEMAAWAVRDGDSMPETAPVPEPSSTALMALGLLVLGMLRFRKQHRG